MLTCPACGRTNPPDASFCTGCGNALGATATSREARRVVTALFCDVLLVDAEGRHSELPAGERPDGYLAAVRAAVERHGGRIEKYVGDVVNGVFGLPIAHEDDALRALRAATEIIERVGALCGPDGRSLAARVGVNTGEVLVPGDGKPLIGDAMNVGARLGSSASPGIILLGQATLDLALDRVTIEPVSPLTLKGKSEPVPAFRLLALRDAVRPARARRPLVGRIVELAALTAALDEVARTGTARLVGVVGDAGVGKSRLIEELVDRAADHDLRHRPRVLAGRCLSYGEGITFWPVAELVHEAAGIGEEDPPETARARLAALAGDASVTERVASAIGLPAPAFPVVELFWGVRRLLERLAVDGPVIVLLDDLHWAEPTLLDLVAHLAANVAGPVLLLGAARRELLERRPDFAGGPGDRRLELDPLGPLDAARLTEQLLPAGAVDARLRDRIVEAAEGNPLFIEQVLSMLTERGTLHWDGARWTAAVELDRIEIPPTIRALLTARLDQLPPGERSAVDPASVIGLVFARAALGALLPDRRPDELDLELDALVERELIRHSVGGVAPAHRFGHALVHDTVYEQLLRGVRADLHAQVGAWTEGAGRAVHRGDELDEIVGYHFEQAVRYRTELGRRDAVTVDLAGRAADRLASAGERALARGDLPAAANLTQRAVELLGAGDDRRAGLLLRLGGIRVETGAYEAAAAALADAEAAARSSGLEALALRARLRSLVVASETGIGDEGDDPEAHARMAIERFEALGDELGLAEAWRFIANLRVVDMRLGDAAGAFERAIAHARAAGDGVLERRMAPALAASALGGPVPATEVAARCTALLERTAGDRTSQARILRVLAQAHAMTGDVDEARREYRQARRDLEELGWTFEAAITSLDSGPVELRAGDPIAAEAELRRDYEALDALGERNFITTVAALLADALLRQGRDDEAARYAAFSAEVADPDDLYTQYLWRQAQARLEARAGAHDVALALAREAVDLTRRTDDPVSRASALLDLAEVLDAAGGDGEAATARAEAVALLEQKGDLAGAAAARR